MQFVIAGDYAEYFDFLRRKNLPRDTSEYIFITDPTRLYGKHSLQVLSVGTYRKSPVYQHHYYNRITRNIRFIDEAGKEIQGRSS